MAQKPIKVSEAIKIAAAAEKTGNLKEALKAYSDILNRFPANAKAKAGVKRLQRAPQGSGMSGFDAAALATPMQGFRGRRLSGIDDPMALSENAVKAAAANKSQNNLLAASQGGNQTGLQQAATETAEQLNHRGGEAYSHNKVHEAIALFEAAISAAPNLTAAKNNLGIALRDVGRFQEAVNILEEARKAEPQDVSVLCNLASVLSDMEQYPEAISAYKRALEVDPNDEIILGLLGNLFAAIGQKKDAIACYEASIAHNPNYTSAYMQLGTLQPFQEGDATLEKLRSVVRKGKLTGQDKVNGHFALGNSYANFGDTETAFDHFSKANVAAKSQHKYDFDVDRKVFEQIKSLFRKGKVSKLLVPEIGASPVSPIFVVGMPRSGSTLIEQVLASHSKVHGAGEVGVMTALMDTILAEVSGGTSDISKDSLRQIRETYLREMASVAAPKKVVVDKNLLNFRYLGFIFAAFPEARVVHMQRDPMAVCWSVFRHNFAGNLLDFSNDQKDIADYYHAYDDLMQFWRAEFPDRFLDLSYEGFTQNQEGETRGLLVYCGLEFETASLEFQSTQRAARTASMVQVRQKVYQGSSQEWMKYESYLSDLIQKLTDHSIL